MNIKIYVSIFCLFLILSIQAISATDNTTNDELSNIYNIQNNNLESNVQEEDVSTENNGTKLSLNEQDKFSSDKKTNEESLTFTDLNNTINDNSNSTINLSNNYKYNGDLDSELIDGISISRNLTIYGNGITIDGSGNARIFSLIDPNLTVSFYNINFINANAEFGGALEYGDAYNCIFTNNKCEYGGGAIYQGNAFNCTFIGNSAFSGGAIYQGNAYNSTFINNTGFEFGGALFEGTAVNCTFTDNDALSGQAICEGTGILCRFYNNTCELTTIVPASINVLNYTSPYKSGEKLIFNLTANDMLFDGFNTTIKIYNNGSLVKTVYAFTGEGWIVDLGVGEYTAVLSLTDYPDENSSNATINISKGNTTVVINPINDTIVGKEIAYNVTVEVAENDYYTAGYNETTFTAEKTNTTVTITPISNVVVGQEVTINYTTNSNGTVTIKVNDQPITGNKFTPTTVGTYNVTVEVAENDYYTAASNQTTFNVEKLASKITVSPVSTIYNVGKYLVITLKDQNGNAIKNAVLIVNLGGSKNYKTDKNGQVKINVANLVPKTYTAKITYAGSDSYNGSTGSAKVTVKKAKPKITAKSASFKLKVKTKKYTVIFKDNKNKALKKTKVTFKVGGKTYTVKTNNKGHGVFKITNLKKKGAYIGVITIPTNKYYNKVTKKVKITVNA